jgi:DNA replication protein DnaC
VRRGHRVLFTRPTRWCSGCSGPSATCGSRKSSGTLDSYDAVILDDIGYVQQSRDEMEVLFTFLAERYERKSVLITSNLVFSEWNRIFKDPMTTAAAIDRLIHHAVILEMAGPRQAPAAEKAAGRLVARVALPEKVAPGTH